MCGNNQPPFNTNPNMAGYNPYQPMPMMVQSNLEAATMFLLRLTLEERALAAQFLEQLKTIPPAQPVSPYTSPYQGGYRTNTIRSKEAIFCQHIRKIEAKDAAVIHGEKVMDVVRMASILINPENDYRIIQLDEKANRHGVGRSLTPGLKQCILESPKGIFDATIVEFLEKNSLEAMFGRSPFGKVYPIPDCLAAAGDGAMHAANEVSIWVNLGTELTGVADIYMVFPTSKSNDV